MVTQEGLMGWTGKGGGDEGVHGRRTGVMAEDSRLNCAAANCLGRDQAAWSHHTDTVTRDRI